MGVCSSNSNNRNKNRDKTTTASSPSNNSDEKTESVSLSKSSSYYPWNLYASRSKLNHSFNLPSLDEHVHISDNNNNIRIPLTVECPINPVYSDEFIITAPYSKTYLIKHLFHDILHHINNKHDTGNIW